MYFLNAVGSTEWNHIHLHYTGVKAKVSETDICEICGGKKMPKQFVYLQSTQGEWENHFVVIWPLLFTEHCFVYRTLNSNFKEKNK